jgi:ATP-dependent DNA helicase RecG
MCAFYNISLTLHSNQFTKKIQIVMPLPININKLLKGRVIEWDRLEFKKGWNPEEVIRTMCAFANDINNWGGGYIIIGVDEIDGKPIFPPAGLQENQIDRIQKELVALCHKIEPHYLPVTEPVFYEDKLIFILWVPGGEVRPYKAPQTLGDKAQKRMYIRQGSVTKPATKEDERFLNTISIVPPFDDRINHVANAFYHRSYENVSPIEISVYPDKMVVLSFPGPLPPVDKEMLKKKKIISREYRNRRIGDFLKELDLTEGRGTGFPIVYGQMALNGSPEPIFETDNIHTHFTAILPVHPEFLKEEAEDNEKKTDLPTLDSPRALEILEFCREAKSRKDIMDMLGIYNNTIHFNKFIKPLLAEKVLFMLFPDNPNNFKQKYYATNLK